MSLSAGNFSFPSMCSRITAGAMRQVNNAAECVRNAFFGTEIGELSATITGVAIVSATLSTTAWSYGPDGWTLNSGTSDRYVVATLPPDFGAFAVRLHLVDPDDQIRVWLIGSEDGRDCYEAGVWDVSGTFTAQVRITEDAVVGVAAVTNAAGDTPSSATCEVDVSAEVTSGNAYTIEVRKSLGFIEFRLNGELAARLKHTPTQFAGQIAVGFVSETDGARVLLAEVAQLVGQTSGAEDILVVACDGDVWATQGGNPVKVGGNVFPTDGRVQMLAVNQVMLLLGPLENGTNARARVFDPVRNTVGLWKPAFGTLPGQTLDGTTTAQVLAQHAVRVVMAGPKGDEQNANFSAVDGGDVIGYLDFDTGSELQGHAYTLGSTRPLKLGKPILAWQMVGKSISVIGCDHAIEAMVGDQALGLFDTSIISETAGVTGNQSMLMLSRGRVIAHTNEGLFLVNASGSGEAISEGALVEVLKITEEERATTTVILDRDPLRSWTMIWKTPDQGAGRHVLYDEQIGRDFKKDQPGYFEIRLPDGIQPTCSTIWKGMLVAGCEDGYLRYFADGFNSDQGTDDEEIAIDARLVGELIAAPKLTDDASIANITLQLTPNSSAVELRVYGGRTAAKVYDSAMRQLLLVKTVDPFQHEMIPLEVRAPALLVEISNDQVAQNFFIEGLDADVDLSADPTSR